MALGLWTGDGIVGSITGDVPGMWGILWRQTFVMARIVMYEAFMENALLTNLHPAFLLGFDVALGAITAISVIRIISFLPMMLMSLVHLITLPWRRRRERIEAEERAARDAAELEKSAQETGFRSGPDLAYYLERVKFAPTHVPPESFMSKEAYPGRNRPN